jgi:hypothetical protein
MVIVIVFISLFKYQSSSSFEMMKQYRVTASKNHNVFQQQLRLLTNIQLKLFFLLKTIFVFCH